MAKEISSKNTKTKILEAYNALVEENQELKEELEELHQEKKTAITPEPPVKKAKPLAEIVTGATINEVIQGLGHLQASFGNAISELSAKLTTEATELEELHQVVESETKQLKELHGVEVRKNTLDELIQKYVAKSQCYEDEMSRKRVAFEQEMAEKQRVWQKEQEEHACLVKERNESLEKSRQREATEYKYELEHTRKQDADDYEQYKKKLDQELDQLAQEKRKEWQEREKAIAEQEKLFEEYEKKAEAFPKELDAAVQKAAAEGKKLVESEAKIQTDLRAKEAESEKRIHELRISSLEGTIKKQAAQIESLSKQLNAVLKQGQDLAVKALERGSSASAYQAIKEQAVKEIALEQTKNLPMHD